MLKWARESIGLSLADVAAAEKLDIERLREWESGGDSPSLAMLRRLGARYKRPLMVFYLPEPPKFNVVRDFRHLGTTPIGEMSPAMRYAIRRAQEKQSWASEYLSESGAVENALVGSLKISADLRPFCFEFRTRLGITVADQESCDTPAEAFKLWRSRIEQLQFFVFQTTGVEPEEMRGCALPDAFAPVAVVNGRDADVAKCFTLLHEIAHLLLGSSAITGTGPFEFDYSETGNIEKFCNRFAGETLVPHGNFIKRVPPNWEARDDDFLSQMSRVYRVSRPVIAYRLMECGFADADYLRRKWPQLQAKPRKQKESTGGPPPHLIALSRGGRSFTKLALSAYHGDAIHGGALTSLIGMNLKYLTQLESVVYPTMVQTNLTG